MEIYCQVTERGLVPLYDSDREKKQRLKVGATVCCKVSTPRNLKFHKKFWAMARLAFDNLPMRLAKAWGITTVEDMVERFKLDLGHYDVVQLGESSLIRTRSISFAAMEQTEFETFYKRCITLIAEKYIVGIDPQALQEELERYY